MEFEVSYSLENEQQFWDELDEIVSKGCESHEAIDDSLRAFLGFSTTYKGEFLPHEDDVARCSGKLLDSTIFAEHGDYVRRQIVHCLLQEDQPDTLHVIAAFLLFDGRQKESTFELMNEEDVFPRLLELIQVMESVDIPLHRLLLQLLYEMSRIQRVRMEDLLMVEDDFIESLFRIIEGHSDDVDDPYHYPIIRVLLVLNEQYMVSAHPATPVPSPVPPIPNKILRILSPPYPPYKTFGENIILLLNRETETSLQLLILKLLYLLFTHPPTHDYFYTNDLRVLVDVIIRNLLDLPHSAAALRHTYLRVLYPLLAHSQLRDSDTHYKRDELRRLLSMLGSADDAATAHFGDVDDTTKRLVTRCMAVTWLQRSASAEACSGCAEGDTDPATDNDALKLDRTMVKRPPRRGKPIYHHPHGRLLTIGGNHQAGESSLSVVEVATHHAKPGVHTPSLGRGRMMEIATGELKEMTEKGVEGVEKEPEKGIEKELEKRIENGGVSIRIEDEELEKSRPRLGTAISPFDAEGEGEA